MYLCVFARQRCWKTTMFVLPFVCVCVRVYMCMCRAFINELGRICMAAWM